MNQNDLIQKAWIDYAICFFLGSFGVHKFRDNKVGLGLLYLFTGGLFGFGWFYDTMRYFVTAVYASIGKEPVEKIIKRIAGWLTAGWFLLWIIMIAACSTTEEQPPVETPSDSQVQEEVGSETPDTQPDPEPDVEPVPEPPVSEQPTVTPTPQPPKEDVHEHSWTAATCTAAKTCACGATEGSPAGHDWKAATCQTPKTCTRCNVTEGEKGSHSWKNATCVEPKTCSFCGAKEGDAVGHKWNNATCTTAKKCSVCGTTDGNALGHTPSGRACATCGSPCVYRTPYGKRYHYDPDCGGENSRSVLLEDAQRAGLTPCGNCAQ